VCILGDSRIQNIVRLKQAGIKADIMLLRTPMLSEVKKVVQYTDISLNSEIIVLQKLSQEAQEKGITHRVILMLEMGERREGFFEKELDTVIEKTLALKGIELYGLGINLACLTGVVPTETKMQEFDRIVETIEGKLGRNLDMVGGGNSANIPLLLQNYQFSKTNNLRIGEGILLGVETVYRTPIPGTHQDAFTLEGELIELKDKPSVPDGTLSQNAYGETPVFEDIGVAHRGLIALGRQDVIVEGLKPYGEGLSIIASSSDHMALTIDSKEGEYNVGDTVCFRMSYGSLVSAFTSPYVHKIYT
jgi:predicted amino acid racemase